MSRAKFYIYWNLRLNCYSVRYKGRVIYHAEEICLTNCTFNVSEAGRQKVLREKQKTVHAFICGEICWIRDCNGPEISYNPYKNSSFVIKNTGEKILMAPFVSCRIVDKKPKILVDTTP